ncbi:hypothetical protein F4818DRAFT_401495 [Hypoxylon cercidicola]|nr:hypothetical protein F4818DRAFT_401495 [Hypoxylon cercidicola]
MARHSRRYSSLASSDRGGSPPPAYMPPWPCWNNEQTPLLKRDRDSESSLENGTSICLGLISLVIQLAIIVLFGFALYKILLLILSTISPHAAIPAPPLLPLLPPTYSVAIIGAGPAGISAAQYLHSKAGSLDVRFNITLFESAPSIGGQLALNDSTGGPVFPYNDRTQDPIIAEDIAGSALMWSNPLFTKASEQILGVNTEFSELPSQQVGYFDGERMVSQTTRPYSKTPTSSWLRLIWKYGSSTWRAGAMSKEGDLRERFTNPPLISDIMQLMVSLDVVQPVQEYAHSGLDSRGIGDPYVTEILAPQAERALSQRVPDISTLAVALSAFQEDVANAYVGGELLDTLEQILGATGTTVRAATEVSGLRHAEIRDDASAWLVKYDARGASGSRAEAFDRVIIAAPCFDLYRAASVDDIEAASVMTYRAAYVTFFTLPARLNPDVYGEVEQVLFLEKQEEGDSLGGVRELAFVREVDRVTVDGNRKIEHMYRALSDGDATERLQQLDLEVTWSYQARLDNAYPLLYPSRRLPPFKLSEKGLWWTPAIHAIASTVDMSWLAGQIVAEEVVKDVLK